jgi:2-polyprenyl-3-methyl-5-hydroxy-6-metoxy-1,4-benzoquinol methylase
MNRSALKFYDQLAPDYHLMFEDFAADSAHQGCVLNKIIRQYHPRRGKLSLLDCSCGIGTQALGLAGYSYVVHATDLSPQAVNGARTRARDRGVTLTFGVADFRKLSRQVKGTFEVVLSCENALPHLLTDSDILLGLRNIRSKLKPGGLFLLGIRDYDSLFQERPTAPKKPAFYKDKLGERIYFQVWDWKKGTPIYKMNLFLLQKLKGFWKAQCHETYYRALRRAELTRFMKKAGFSNVRWLMPNETGYLQPLAVATRK